MPEVRNLKTNKRRTNRFRYVRLNASQGHVVKTLVDVRWCHLSFLNLIDQLSVDWLNSVATDVVLTTWSLSTLNSSTCVDCYDEQHRQYHRQISPSCNCRTGLLQGSFWSLVSRTRGYVTIDGFSALRTSHSVMLALRCASRLMIGHSRTFITLSSLS